MYYLWLSLIILACTPMLVGVVMRYQRASRWGAAILLVAILHNIFAHIILENIQIFGWKAVAAAVVGALLFGLGDVIFFGERRHDSRWFFFLVQIFLAIHALIDGAALVGSDLTFASESWTKNTHAAQLSSSIIMHRLLFEVFIWKYFSDRYGKPTANWVLINVGIATVVGFVVSKALFSLIPDYFGLFEAFIGGALLHLVYDYFKERIRTRAETIIAGSCEKPQGSHIP